MPPNNFVVAAGACEGDQKEEVGDSSNNGDPYVLNRKSKNALNSYEGTSSKLDVNGNVVNLNKVEEEKKEEYRIEFAWFNIIGFIYLHYAAVIGLFEARIDWCGVFMFAYGVASGLGITAGAHRLWAHGAYKANTFLKILLVYCETAAFQNSIYEWVRDHRVHHKFTDTNADPHNASRGFFFSHMGWLCCKKHPDVKKFGAKVDMSDLERDPVIMFQHKYYLVVMPIACFIVPMLVPLLWGTPFHQSYYLNIFRYVLVLHFTWLVNSYAHFFGNKPYDKHIKPTDSYTVALLAFGEGWHNYHHVFPYDYKTSEHDKYWCNYTTGFLELFAWLGWATDLKTVAPHIVQKRILRTGDGSHEISQLHEHKRVENSLPKAEDSDHIWGWQDDNLTAVDKSEVTIINRTYK